METVFNADYDYLFTMCVLGDELVGKSSLIQRYTEGTFQSVGKSIPTIGIDFKLKYLSRNGHKLLLQLWDSSGKRKYRSVIKHIISRMMGIILVLDVTSTDSLAQLGQWIEVIKKHANPGTQVSKNPAKEVELGQIRCCLRLEEIILITYGNHFQLLASLFEFCYRRYTC